MSHWNREDTTYDSAGEHYDQEYFRHQSRDGELRGKLNAWKFEKYLPGRSKILDFGCGDGSLLKVLGGSHGVEINPHAAAAAREKGLDVRSDVDQLPEKFFDLIVSNHCIEHVEHPLAVIRGLRKAIKDDGMLVVCVPCHKPGFAFREKDRDFHLYSWSAANLGNMIKLGGFEVVHAQELLHRWPPKWRHIIKYFGLGAFHIAARIWAVIDRSSSQVICVAVPRKS